MIKITKLIPLFLLAAASVLTGNDFYEIIVQTTSLVYYLSDINLIRWQNIRKKLLN